MNFFKFTFKHIFCTIYNIFQISLYYFLSFYIQNIPKLIINFFHLIMLMHPPFQTIKNRSINNIIIFFQFSCYIISKQILNIISITAILNINQCWKNLTVMPFPVIKFHIIYRINYNIPIQNIISRQIPYIISIQICSQSCIYSPKINTKRSIRSFQIFYNKIFNFNFIIIHLIRIKRIWLIFLPIIKFMNKF